MHMKADDMMQANLSPVGYSVSSADFPPSSSFSEMFFSVLVPSLFSDGSAIVEALDSLSWDGVGSGCVLDVVSILKVLSTSERVRILGSEFWRIWYQTQSTLIRSKY